MREYRLIDWISQGYAAFVCAMIGVAACLNPGIFPALAPALIAHVAGMLAIHGIVHLATRFPDHKPLAFLRDLYPLIAYIFFYRDTGLLNQALAAPAWDPRLIQWEHQLFGAQPSVRAMELLPHPALSELLYAAYFSFYLMIAGLAVWFRWRDPRHFPQFIAVISFLLYASYCVYCFIPAVGPRQFFVPSPERELYERLYGMAPSEIPTALTRGPFARIMHWIYENLETWGAAFPSSHVAVAWGTAWFSWRYIPRLRWIHPAVALLLSIATVYCRYHYAIDALAGAAFCLVFLPLGIRLQARMDRPQLRTSS